MILHNIKKVIINNNIKKYYFHDFLLNKIKLK